MKPLAIVSMHAAPLAPLGAGANGGMTVYVRAVSQELGRRGIPTEIFTLGDGSGDPRRRLGPRSWVNYISVPQRPTGEERLFDLLPGFTEGILERVASRNQSLALVHSHYWLSGWSAARLRDEWRIPWFHTAHTLARVKNERATSGASMEPEHRITVEQSVVREADRLIASSQEEAEDLARLYGADRAKVALVAPGVDLSVFRPRPRQGLRLRQELGLEGGRVIVFAGRLERLKGTEIVIQALALLQEQVGQPITLLVLGDDSLNGARESREVGGERARLQRLAESLGVLSQTRFLGAVSQEQLASYLALADVCVVPSYSESFGLVALEAAASGTPVVAARVGGLPLVVKDGLNGYTLLSHEPGQYAERIGRLLQDDELRRCFSRRSRIVASHFTWQATVDRLLSVYSGDDLRALPAAAAN